MCTSYICCKTRIEFRMKIGFDTAEREPRQIFCVVMACESPELGSFLSMLLALRWTKTSLPYPSMNPNLCTLLALRRSHLQQTLHPSVQRCAALWAFGPRRLQSVALAMGNGQQENCRPLPKSGFQAAEAAASQL